ncbi:hypothetical protein HYFRA_00009466 [Hymenoscyphus fraxineus]|uniref:Uncharacterized protein n=1 Tax=Hymenoscyphus fraxineus TaxID=746836 RepID=A0A9N9KX63_9HELO|nr:hypothetical protein HYFRA_00009466 [Hymenoscyphus fraxineus]
MQFINFPTALVLLTTILSTTTALPLALPPLSTLPTKTAAWEVKVRPEYLFHLHGGPFSPPWLEKTVKTVKQFKNKLTGTPEPPPYHVDVLRPLKGPPQIKSGR